MRRLDSNTKEKLLWCRTQIVYLTEQNEAQLQSAVRNDLGKEAIADSLTAYIKLIEAIDDVALEEIKRAVYTVCDEHGIDAEAKDSAFPFEGDAMDDSCLDYCEELARDIRELWDIPAVEVVDQLESWLDELDRHHKKNS